MSSCQQEFIDYCRSSCGIDLHPPQTSSKPPQHSASSNSAEISSVDVFIPILFALLMKIVVFSFVDWLGRSSRRRQEMDLRVDEALRMMPHYRYNENFRLWSQSSALPSPSFSDESCSICLEEYKDGERVRILQRCGHMFHSACITPWLTKNRFVCAICRCKAIGRDTRRLSVPEIDSADSGSDIVPQHEHRQ